VTLAIRPSVAADLYDLARLQAASFDEPWSVSEIEDLISAPGGFGLAAVADGRLSGFLIGRAIAGEAEIITVAVDPAVRRGGLGSALVERAAGVASEAGAACLFLEVAVDNEAALGLYEGAGFSRAGFRAGYYVRKGGPPADALVLRRDLTP
jgi:ribosomal-protein-alanine N-acetyltransferase